MNESANSEGLISEPLSGLLNVKEEDDPHIVKAAREKRVVFLAFIAPWVGVRISPVQEARASISLPDEFGIEAALR